MIDLRNMTTEEFAQYRAIFIREYAQDLQKTREYSPEIAQDRATESIDIMLTQGSDTADHTLWCIQSLENHAPVVGYLWLHTARHSAWINDFYILPAWRNRGLGQAALLAMKVRLQASGVKEVGLRVAPENPAAKALYDKCGFHITGINMSQSLV